MLINMLKGVVIGIATVIPGVSGGTMALVMGIYQRLLAAVGNVTPAAAINLVKSLGGGSEGGENDLGFWQTIRAYDWLFLLQLAIGGAAAIAVFSKIISGLLTTYPEPTYGFFLGLIILSAYFPIKMLRKFTIVGGVFLLLGAATPILISMSVDKDTRIQRAVNKAQKKAAKEGRSLPPLPAAIASAQPSGSAQASGNAQPSADDSLLTTTRIAQIVGAGAIAVAASILPGVSGSFILLLFGLYFPIMAAISSVNIPILLTFGIGCAVGLVTVTRLVNYLLAKFWNETVCFLIGLMLGSIYGIWPFQESVTFWDQVVHLGPTWPDTTKASFWPTVAAIAAGAVIIAGMIKFSPPEDLEAAPSP